MIGPSKSYCSLVDEQLLEQYLKEQEGDAYYPLRPSSAGYCARKLAHQLNAYMGHEPKVVEDRKASVIRLLNLGHSIEYHVLKYMENMPGFKLRFKQQVVSLFKLPSGRLIEGSMDAVLWSEEHKAVMDVKSVGNGWSKAYATRWDEMLAKYDSLPTMKKFDEGAYYIEDVMAWLDEVGEDALVANVFQLNLYACSDFLRERGVNHAVLMRYCKNDSKHHEIRFKPSMELFKLVEEKFAVIENAVMKKRPEEVPKEYALGSMACGFCPYQERCHGDADAKRAYFKTLGPKRWAKRVNEIHGGEKLAQMLNELKAAELKQAAKERLEKEIIVELDNLGVSKVKLETGEVYEIKQYKSPKPYAALVRSKE